MAEDSIVGKGRPNLIDIVNGLPVTPDLQLREFDPVTKPKHYNSHPSGIECIQVTEHLSFCLGNAIKYLWRADLKNGVEDLKKAIWYIEREIKRREKQ